MRIESSLIHEHGGSALFGGSSEGVALSSRACALWAKTGAGESGNLWSPLYVHMGDSACAARKLWDEWLADSVRRQISSAIDGDDSAAAAFASWLAGVHDIGKATPAFQYKVPERAERVEETGLRLPCSHAVNHPPLHAAMSEILLEEWLDARGWECPWQIGSIVGSHHGAPPANDSALDGIRAASRNFPLENLGDDDWHSVQVELLEWIFKATGMSEYEGHFQSLTISQPAQVLLSALVIMSDWIASNSDLFPLASEITSLASFQERADVGWNALGLPSAWHAVCHEGGGQELFRSRFDNLPEGARLRPAQTEALSAALGMERPGLLIIEAPMGNGKTEASLLCGEVFAAATGAGGIAYLLPTMATSNAMFGRVEEWLKRVPDARGKSTQSMQLLHGKAALNGEYAKLRSWGGTWMGDEAESCAEEDVIAHQWFGGRKRGLLSSFVVGTVDQLLMAALKMKHVQLRHLGLAGKVVVIDEVHAYDAYMNTYLDRVLTWLGAYGVPTILLSATLPSERRRELIRAYRGRDGKPTGRRSKRKDVPESPRDESGHPAYPLITAATRTGDLGDGMYRTCADSSAGTDVVVQRLDDDDASLAARLGDLLSDGGCACVLRDTVGRAQRTYDQLKRVFGAPCVKLVHSRFIAIDRMANDDELLRTLGPDSNSRPSKLIVVGTQVIEQSLDIDFDVMFTDVAPIDLLLQRMGRLHRHQRGEGQSQRPEKLRQARCYLTGVEDWRSAPPEIAAGIDNVYPRALLWRSLLALEAKRDEQEAVSINLPHDIASLVEFVYSPEGVDEQSLSLKGSQGWLDALRQADDDLRERRDKAQLSAKTWLLGKPAKPEKQGASLIGWLRDSYSAMDEAKGRAAVRDTDDSIEVIAVCRSGDRFELFPWIVDEQGNRPPKLALGDGSGVPNDEAARLAAQCTVSLPPRLSAKWAYEKVVAALEAQARVPGWQESRWLRGQLVLAFDASYNAVIETESDTYRLHYSREAGLELISADKKGEDAK